MGVHDDILSWTAERAAARFEGFKVEVVSGRIIMTPRSDVMSWTILDVQMAAMTAGIDWSRLLSDVLIRFPGEPPRVPDVAILEEGAAEPYSYEDILAAVEMVSVKSEGKVRQYARFGVPIYLIIDPFLGQCTLLTRPKGDSYASRDEYTYGETITLRLADGSTVDIPTTEFKRKNRA